MMYCNKHKQCMYNFLSFCKFTQHGDSIRIEDIIFMLHRAMKHIKSCWPI